MLIQKYAASNGKLFPLRLSIVLKANVPTAALVVPVTDKGIGQGFGHRGLEFSFLDPLHQSLFMARNNLINFNTDGLFLFALLVHHLVEEIGCILLHPVR